MSLRKIPDDTKTFHFYNANPKNNRTGDCVIRAIACATGKSWDEVLTDLMKYAIKYKLMPNDTKCYTKYLADLGWVKQNQPRKFDNTKYTGVQFVEDYMPYMKSKVVIAHIGGHHIVCIKDGKIQDIWNSEDGCIGNYWVKVS